MKDFFLARFYQHMKENNEIEDASDYRNIIDIKCRHILEEEDLDIICGGPKISGKDAALQMEKEILNKFNEKSKKR
jgi:hypothetical protein